MYANMSIIQTVCLSPYKERGTPRSVNRMNAMDDEQALLGTPWRPYSAKSYTSVLYYIRDQLLKGDEYKKV